MSNLIARQQENADTHTIVNLEASPARSSSSPSSSPPGPAARSLPRAGQSPSMGTSSACPSAASSWTTSCRCAAIATPRQQGVRGGEGYDVRQGRPGLHKLRESWPPVPRLRTASQDQPQQLQEVLHKHFKYDYSEDRSAGETSRVEKNHISDDCLRRVEQVCVSPQQQLGHRKPDCPNKRIVKEIGHMIRECKKPTGWCRVQCSISMGQRRSGSCKEQLVCWPSIGP